MKNKKNNLLLAFLISFGIGLTIVVPSIIKGHGIMLLVDDWNMQQIPFLKLFNESLKTGSLSWTWNNDLGSNFIGTFSFYNFLSPFNLILYLFKSSWTEYLIGPMLALKYGVAGLTSYLYLKRYIKKDYIALLGSILYSFSGFQLTNTLFYHFHDIVALFPLLLYSFDRLLYDNKKGFYSIMVVVSALTNWYFFIQEMIFLIIYFIIKLLSKEIKLNKKLFLSILIESILGIGISAFILIPSALFILDNPRVNISLWTIKSALLFSKTAYLNIIRSFFFPAEAMNYRSMLGIYYNYNSIEAFLPFVGFVFTYNFIKKNYKDWNSRIIFLLLIISLIPILNNSFYLFTIDYYTRRFYLLILMMVLATCRSLDNKYFESSGIYFSLVMVGIYFLLCLIFKVQLIVNFKLFIFVVLGMLIPLILIFFILKMSKNKIKHIFISVILFSSIWGNYIIYNYKQKPFEYQPLSSKYYDSEKVFDNYKNYRINSSNSCDVNYGYLTNTYNIKVWNSNISGNAFSFYSSIGIERYVETNIDVKNKELNDYLGIKYVIECGENDLSKYGYEYIETIDEIKIYKNNEAKDFGFYVDNLISDNEFATLTNEEKIKTLNSTLVLPEYDFEAYNELYENNKLIEKDYKITKNKFTKDGFVSEIITNFKTIAVFQIPADNGWKLTVNGKKTDYIYVDNGMMGVLIEPGTNEIVFKYKTPGFKVGVFISSLSLVSFSIYIYIIKKNKYNL